MKRVGSLAVVLSVLLAACSPYEIAEEQMDVAYDLHSISVLSGQAKYDIASYSHIGRSAHDHLQPDKVQWVTVDQGDEQGWSWDFLAEPSIAPALAGYAHPTELPPRLSDGKLAVLPSFGGMMRRLHAMAQAVIGPAVPDFEYRVSFIPVGINAKQYVEHASNESIVVDYYLPAPQDASPEAKLDWFDFVARLGTHEFLHAYVETDPQLHMPNAFTEEVTAYTFEDCAQLSVLGEDGGLRFLDAAGHELDVRKFTGGDEGQGYMKSSAEISNDARLFAMYNIVHVVGKSTVQPGDRQAKQLIYGLCRAMVHAPVDLTRGFYPRASVKPLTMD